MAFKSNITKFFLVWISVLSPLITYADSGPERVRMLVDMLEHDRDYKVRIAAAQALSQIADGTVADWMIRAFRHDDNEAVRLSILYAVSEIPDERILSPLIELANQEILSPKERMILEQTLWNYTEVFNTSAWIAEALNSNDVPMKKTAVWILGVIGDENMVPLFQKLCASPTEDVQAETLKSLSKVGNESALKTCQEATFPNLTPQIDRAVKFCIQSNQFMIQTRTHPAFKKKMKILLDQVKKKSYKPVNYLAYLNKNVNQREVDVAMSFLQPQARAAAEKPIKLIEREKLNTFQLIVDMVSKYEFDSRDLEVLKSIIRENSDGIDGCYLRELPTSPTLKGDVKTFFKVLKTGAVEQVKVTETTLNNSKVEKCICEQISQFEFPSLPLEYVNLIYTFSFTPPKTIVNFH